MVELRSSLQALAAQGIYIGTSSWKYPGWMGQIYTEERYLTRGKFSKAKFDAECLTEYAEMFSTVCVDAGYYTFPSEKWLTGMAAQVPDSFRFAFKVPEDITVRTIESRSAASRLVGGRVRRGNPIVVADTDTTDGILIYDFDPTDAHHRLDRDPTDPMT